MCAGYASFGYICMYNDEFVVLDDISCLCGNGLVCILILDKTIIFLS